MSSVKEWSSQYNPFNSAKLFAHVSRWKEIETAENMPSPALVTVDPTNICNLDCAWCNAEYIRTKNPKKMTQETLEKIADFLPYWGLNERWRGVPAVCIAGGGEPLTHPYTGDFISRMTDNGTLVGVVTNGVYIPNHLKGLTECTWVGVSVDAGTPETYLELKRKDEYVRVLQNIEKLAKSIERTPLGARGQGPGISYKFLMHPKNVSDIHRAAQNAKNAGCKNMHIRPFGTPWDKINGPNPNEFKFSDIEIFREQIDLARRLEDETFRVFGITHKFDGNFRKKNEFGKCYAIYMTAVLQPPIEKGFNLGLCCDRRGDERLTFKDIQDPKEINNIWGSEAHRKLKDLIDVSKCPRCTYQPHNQIFENVVEIDNTTYEFI